MSKIIVNCQICNLYLYEKDGEGTSGVSSAFCPHCYLIYTKLQEAISDHRGVVSEVVSRILREYCSEIKTLLLMRIEDGKYCGRVINLKDHPFRGGGENE